MKAISDIEGYIAGIPDPEIPVVTIKDLGILRGVEYKDGNYVVTITPTYTACPAMKMISDDIVQRLGDHGIHNVKVALTYSPAWSTDWINTEAKERMRQYGISPPQHSSCSHATGALMSPACPRCGSLKTELISRFGSTACKSYYKCHSCAEPFEHFKCHS
jgi:ring-1,2-phenylacetyl-CoA epoxidase subunit PaaD